MKACSKCGCEKPLLEFAPDKKYSDGKHCYCRQCQRQVRVKWLAVHPLCSRCRIRPHRASSGWCDECHHQGRGNQYHRRANGDGVICVRCRKNPRCENHSYCNDCRNKSVREWRMRAGKYKAEQLHKKTTRHYVNSLFKRGKIRRQPCKYCGKPSEHFHHLSYESRSLNIEHLCKRCHLIAHDIERNLLTAFAVLV